MSQHDHSTPPSDTALRVKALESLLVEQGRVDPAALDALIDTYENKVGPARTAPRRRRTGVRRALGGPGLRADPQAARGRALHLERLAVEKGLVRSGDLDARKAAWKRAFLNTPHAQPILLAAGEVEG
jgi:hypothetical protein